uniref:Copper tolerance protein n=1 Tax=Acetithermum autotrophicum TaxID=1446466 RepID=H5SSK6_ACEAU|nr:copper tolerance protein [Candidatus Acetothermum autotrophicum]
MIQRLVSFAALCLIAIALLTGCKRIPSVIILATEYEFLPSIIEVKAGQIRIDLRNVGNSSHALRVEGKQEKVIVAPGERKIFLITLSVGRYRFTCPLGDHENLGMTGIILVRP